MHRVTFIRPLFPLLLWCAAACAHESTSPPATTGGATATARLTEATQPSTTTPRERVHISDDLAKACSIVVGNAEESPKFDFDDSGLLPGDKVMLDQVAKCVTTGPLKGRDLSLVGRADPRGSNDYNLALGEHRANAVVTYLASLGVAKTRLHETSRGDLDAQGHDEASWRKDRRVDIDVAH